MLLLVTLPGVSRQFRRVCRDCAVVEIDSDAGLSDGRMRAFGVRFHQVRRLVLSYQSSVTVETLLSFVKVNRSLTTIDLRRAGHLCVDGRVISCLSMTLAMKGRRDVKELGVQGRGDVVEWAVARYSGLESFRFWTFEPTVPHSIGNFVRLQLLDLSGCGWLKSLPESIGDLGDLRVLNLSNCSWLLWLPESIGRLGKLEWLKLCGCGELRLMPESTKNLGELRQLDVKYCDELVSLPDLSDCRHLRAIEMFGCDSMKNVPNWIGGLCNLELLSVGMCYYQLVDDDHLTGLPLSIGGLKRLRRLHLGWCFNLASVPETIGGLKGLVFLDLSLCEVLSSLPDSIGDVTTLETLLVVGCVKLRTLPRTMSKLGKLRILDVTGCSELPRASVAWLGTRMPELTVVDVV
jgi:Leucine-rich repeat (LRR) protein